MITRRSRHQQGSLARKTREKGDAVWELRFYEGRKRRTVTIGTLKEYPTESAVRNSPSVQGLLLKINMEGAASLHEPTFGQVLSRYEDEAMPERHSTRMSYQSIMKNHIWPRWGQVPLKAVKTLAVEDWLKRLALAPKTKTHIKGLMHRIFTCCQRWELTDKNPIALVEVKGGSKRLRKPEVITESEFTCLLNNLKEPHHRAMGILAGCLGLRASEIVALRWSDVDFEERTLRVERSIVHGRVADTKTEYSRDVVPLDYRVAEALVEYKSRCPDTPEGWMFANPATGRPYHQEQIQKTHLQAAAKAAGIVKHIGWHTFRHSHRSWLDASGAAMTVQKELMRHASIQTTMNIYGGASIEHKREAQGKVVEKLLPAVVPVLNNSAVAEAS